jgi:hypothetical protein
VWAAAVSVLVAGIALAASTPVQAGGVSGVDTNLAVRPTGGLASGLTQFTISGTAVFREGVSFGAVAATFNGAAAKAVGNDRVSNETGDFSVTFNIPAGSVLCGTNTVSVQLQEFISNGDRQADIFVDAGSVTIQGFCSITVSPLVVGNQQLPVTYAVTPSGFPRSEAPFTLTVDGTPTPFTTDGGGNLGFTASPSCGTHQVTLTEGSGEFTIGSASADFLVLCPAVTANPASITLAGEPQQVQVTGTQFHSGQPAQITLDGTPVGSTVTDESGGFQVPITAARLDCGAHRVTATEQPSGAEGSPSFLFSASATLQVTRCTLKLTLPPDVVGGEAARVTGSGFAPGVPVRLTWKLPGAGGAALPGTLTITPDAAGNIDGYFLVVPPGKLGPRQCVATQGKLKLTADTVVTVWPTQPSPAGQLVYRG